MAITLEQIDRTPNSVTFSVSGITGDRATYIWDVFEQEWVLLKEAYDDLYIKNYSTSGGDNGTITVEFWDSRVGLNDYDNEIYWYDGDYNYKCWDFAVLNAIGSVPTRTSTFTNPPFTDVQYITTIVEFFWDNAPRKYYGDTFDMTLADHIRLQWFATYIYYWVAGVYNNWSIYINYLYGEDMREAAQKIYNTAYNLSSTNLPNRSSILTDADMVLQFAYTDNEVYASHLNSIKDAINDFNLKY